MRNNIVKLGNIQHPTDSQIPCYWMFGVRCWLLDVFTLFTLLSVLFSVHSTFAQIDPIRRNLLQLGVDQPLVGKGPQAVYR